MYYVLYDYRIMTRRRKPEPPPAPESLDPGDGPSRGKYVVLEGKVRYRVVCLKLGNPALNCS